MGEGFTFDKYREVIYISFSFRLSLQLLEKTIVNLIIPLTKYIRIIALIKQISHCSSCHIV